MKHSNYEVAHIIEQFGDDFVKEHHPNTWTTRTLNALKICRTVALGGHKEKCDHCGKIRISYDSCRNRHCPKCQAAAGIDLFDNMKKISKKGKYLYPVKKLSIEFRSNMMKRLKKQLRVNNQLSKHQSLIDKACAKDWVVYSEPSFADADRVIKYLGNYTHRIAISNHRIQNIDQKYVSFFYKDYADGEKRKLTRLTGIEFLRRFCMHILPKGFVKVRYYGVLSNRYSKQTAIYKNLLFMQMKMKHHNNGSFALLGLMYTNVRFAKKAK